MPVARQAVGVVAISALSVLVTLLGTGDLSVSTSVHRADTRSEPELMTFTRNIEQHTSRFLSLPTPDRSLQNASNNVSEGFFSNKIGVLLHIVLLSNSPDRVEALRNTWLRDVPFTIFTEVPKKFPGVQALALKVRRTNFNQDRNLYLDEVPQLQEALEWVLEHTESLYVLHMDDDALVCLERLLHTHAPFRSNAPLEGSRLLSESTSWCHCLSLFSSFLSRHTRKVPVLVGKLAYVILQNCF